MPNFPTYRGELPACLNPRKARHYFLLAYWVFFRSTALKCYLYQVDPELYKTGKGKEALFGTLHILAYRNLYLMAPIIALFLALLVSVPFPLMEHFIFGIPVDILAWLFKVIIGVAVGVAFGVAGGVAGSVAGGVAGGVAVGVGLGVGVAFGLAFGMGVGVVFCMALGVGVGVAFGLAFGGMIGNLGVGVGVGVLFGMGFGILSGMTFGMAISIADCVALSMSVGVGASRAIFYPIQWILSLLSLSNRIKHPFFWDELIVLPLPYIRRSLDHTLQQNEQKGLFQLAEIMSNPFQGWLMQKILHDYLHQKEAPLHFIYNRILDNIALNTYMFAPLVAWQWKYVPNYHSLLLGELAGKQVKIDFSDDWLANTSEKLVWWLTNPFREKRSTPLTQFAALLYALYKQDRASPADTLNQTWAKEAYTGIKHYPNGVEISQSFVAFTRFLNYQNLTDLIQAQTLIADLPEPHTAIRPTVMIAITRLGQIGTEVAIYQDSTSRVNKLSALARAADNLEELKAYIHTEVNEPERFIIEAIIEQWQPLLIEASGELGQFALIEPVTNPYVAGNPVTGALFVGRDHVMLRLEELWRAHEAPSVILYGHRRMGKTSILKNLGARFSPHSHIVDFNMQLRKSIKSTGQLIYSLALACYDRLTPEQQLALGQPTSNDFSDDDFNITFIHFLERLNQQLQNQRLLITVDEFEIIEDGIKKGYFDPNLLAFWRGIIQTYPWFIMAFAGLHNLEEMCHDYWHPLFGSVTAIPISFLTHGAARQLIIQPNPDFPLDYDADAIENIIQLSGGQPYLVQLICHALVSRFNRQTFEEGAERERRFSLSDVQAVIESKALFRDGNAYFAGVWAQATVDDVQPVILKTLAATPDGLTVVELAAETHLSEQALQQALKVLKNHDVIKKQGDSWVYTVILMQRWVREIVMQRTMV